MGLLNIFAGAMSSGAQKVQEALATEQKAMTATMLEKSRQEFENKRQDKMLLANKELSTAQMEHTTAEAKETRAQAKTIHESDIASREKMGERTISSHEELTSDANQLQRELAVYNRQAQSGDVKAQIKSHELISDRLNNTNMQVAEITRKYHHKSATATELTAIDQQMNGLQTYLGLLQKEANNVMGDPALKNDMLSQVEGLKHRIGTLQAQFDVRLKDVAGAPPKAVAPPAIQQSSKGEVPAENYAQSLKAHPGRKADVDAAWTAKGYTIPSSPASGDVTGGLLQNPASINRRTPY